MEQKAPPLNKVDATRYPIGHTVYSWLCSQGYRVKIEGDRLDLVRRVKRIPRDAREVFIAASVGGLLLIVIIWLFDVVPNLRAEFARPAAAVSCVQTLPADAD